MIGEGDRESQAGGPACVKGVGAGENRNGEGTPGTTDWTLRACWEWLGGNLECYASEYDFPLEAIGC